MQLTHLQFVWLLPLQLKTNFETSIVPSRKSYTYCRACVITCGRYCAVINVLQRTPLPLVPWPRLIGALARCKAGSALSSCGTDTSADSSDSVWMNQAANAVDCIRIFSQKTQQAIGHGSGLRMRLAMGYCCSAVLMVCVVVVGFCFCTSRSTSTNYCLLLLLVCSKFLNTQLWALNVLRTPHSTQPLHMRLEGAASSHVLVFMGGYWVNASRNPWPCAWIVFYIFMFVCDGSYRGLWMRMCGCVWGVHVWECVRTDLSDNIPTTEPRHGRSSNRGQIAGEWLVDSTILRVVCWCVEWSVPMEQPQQQQNKHITSDRGSEFLTLLWLGFESSTNEDCFGERHTASVARPNKKMVKSQTIKEILSIG